MGCSAFSFFAVSSPATTSSAAPSQPTKGIAVGLALGMVGAIAFSGKAIIVKLAYRHGVDVVTQCAGSLGV